LRSRFRTGTLRGAAYCEARAALVHRIDACTLLRWPSDIWPRHYIGGLTGIFKPD
jgi:hypothetical protein